MKYSILIAATLMMAATACNNAPTSGTTATTADSMQPASTASEATAPATKPVAEIIDPVCGMVKDSTWTEYTVYKGDTVWFCAAPEKTAFEAHPEKYEANLHKH